MKTILRNLLSVLRRFKMATALNILGLSVAFAAFMIIMMQISYDLGFDRSHPGSDRIFCVEAGPLLDFDKVAILPRPFIEAFMHSSPHIEAGAYRDAMTREALFTVEADDGRDSYLENVLRVSTGYASLFSFDMTEGSDRALEDPEKLLIPESLARKFFGPGPATGLRLKGMDRTYTVGGVFRDIPLNSSVPNVIYRSIEANENINDWGDWNYVSYIRVNEPGNVAGLYENFRNTFDFSAIDNEYSLKDIALSFVPLADMHFEKGISFDVTPKASRQTLVIILGIAIIIVLIAGINYMNFSASLTPMRIRSINTQKVLGGSAVAIRLALMAEAVSIALLSFLAAMLIVSASENTFLARLVDGGISLKASIPLAAVTAGVALLTGFLAGLYPAWYMTSFPPAMALKGSYGLPPSGRRLKNALICIQFIASFVLIIGASFMYLQNHFMRHAGLGFEKDNLIVAGINGRIFMSRDAVSGRLKSFADIEGVGYSQSLLSGDLFMRWVRDYHDREISFDCLPVDHSFLEVIGIETSAGRGFRPEDANKEQGAFILNEKARATFDLELNDKMSGSDIVGFIPDMNFASLHREITPMAFFVYGDNNHWGAAFDYAYIRVKAGSDPVAAIEHVRSALKEFDSDYPFNVRFFDDVLNRTYEKEQTLGRLISLFSLMAILISIVGVFGLVVFESEHRRREISLRKVLGSTTGQILVMFNRTYLRILALCFVVAAPAAWYAVSRWLENFAYRTPLYWWVYPAALTLVAILTISVVTFQSWHAANTNPAESIRAE
ncbi:MAG: ABC transporter permease [Tannerellaceae bacterium]|jgi:putative ABC transport system permease protein|nr:ABC transporter permease [Tannerellaceae bacterium]